MNVPSLVLLPVWFWEELQEDPSIPLPPCNLPDIFFPGTSSWAREAKQNQTKKKGDQNKMPLHSKKKKSTKQEDNPLNEKTYLSMIHLISG